MQHWIDWSYLIGILVLSSWMWTKAQRFGWRRLSDISMILLIVFAAAIGEQYYLNNQSIPWCWGIESEINERNGHASIIFLVLATLVVQFFARWGMIAYNKIKKFPGTLGQMSITMVIIIISLHFTITGTAYYKKMSGNEPGTTVVSALRSGTIAVLGFSETLLEDGDFFPGKAD